MIEILVPRWKSQKHIHKCPVCKKLKEEVNDVCRKETAAHIFPCISCLQDYRRRFGTFSDELLDGYFDSQAQRELIAHVAPDAISDDLDRRDAERRRREACDALYGPAPDRTFEPVTTTQEQIMDEATRLTEEEITFELEKIKKEEEF